MRPSGGSIMRKGSLAAGGSPARDNRPGPSEGDVRSMGDILPHVNKGVIKAYLTKYGDQMQAIG
jgi:hypothetical protein